MDAWLLSAWLAWVMRHQPITLAMPIIAIVLNVFLYIVVPKGFFPQQDTGRLGGGIQAEQDISFAAMRQKLVQYVGIVGQDPAIQNVVALTGGNTASNPGRMFITLKPLNSGRCQPIR